MRIHGTVIIGRRCVISAIRLRVRQTGNNLSEKNESEKHNNQLPALDVSAQTGAT